MSEIPNCPAVEQCQCFSPEAHEPCVCGQTEKALRAWCHSELPAMTTEQREWCLSEIDSVEGYRRSDYDTTDELLANGVLSAWVDYCRDKGML